MTLFQYDRCYRLGDIFLRIILIPLSTTRYKASSIFPQVYRWLKIVVIILRGLFVGAVLVADYYVSSTTAPFFSPLMRGSLCLVCKRPFREISRVCMHFYLTWKTRINANERFINALIIVVQWSLKDTGYKVKCHYEIIVYFLFLLWDFIESFE